MPFSTHAQSISDLKAHAADILDRLATDGEPVPVTQNGEARAVLREVHTCEETEETLAMLKLLALGQQHIEAGNLTPARDAIARLKGKSVPA